MTADLSSTHWRKSSYSSDHIETECVEVADLDPMVGIRDSKNPNGPKLAFSRKAFRDLSHRAKADELNP